MKTYRGLKDDSFKIDITTYEGYKTYKRFFSLQDAIQYVADAMELPHNRKITIKRTTIRDKV